MYQLIFELPNVFHEFLTVNSEIITLKQVGGLEKRKLDDFSICWVSAQSLLYNLALLNGIIIANDINGSSLFFSLENGNKLKENSDKFIHGNDIYALFFCKKRQMTYLCQHDKANPEWEKSFKFGQHRFFTEHSFFHSFYLNASVFETRLFLTGETLWQLDITETGRYQQYNVPGPWLPGHVEKFIGIWQGKLYVAITNHTILEVEMQSGEVLRMWRELPENYKTAKLNHLPPTSKFQLYSHDGKLKAVYTHIFIEIDLVSGAIIVHDYTDLFKSMGFTFQARPDFVIDNKYILNGGQTRDPISGEYSNEIVFFNHQTLEIEWRHVFPPQCGHIVKIELAGNLLFCLDQKGTLHIFERQGARLQPK